MRAPDLLAACVRTLTTSGFARIARAHRRGKQSLNDLAGIFQSGHARPLVAPRVRMRCLKSIRLALTHIPCSWPARSQG